MKAMTAGLALVLAAFAVGAPTKPEITKVTQTSVGGGIEIAVHGVNVPKPKAFFLSDQTTYIVQFAAPLTPSSSGTIRVGEAGVSYYKFVRYQPNVARVLVKVAKGVVPTVSQDGDAWLIRVGVTAPTQAAATDDEMQKAINELKAPVVPVGTTNFASSNNALLRPGQIIGAEKTASFTEAAYTSTLATDVAVPAPIGSPFRDTQITLTVNQADILTILEAFARQANVNIVTAPDVSPKDKPLLLSLSMRDVDLDFAMTTVASLADLRFTRIANTFIVSKTADFSSRVGSIMKSMGAAYETRVVNISSGEATQIREATLQALPQDGPDGYYEIVDPTKKAAAGTGSGATETGSAGSAGNAGNAGNAGAANAGNSAAGGSAPTSSTPDERAKYVMLIGEPRRLDVIEAYVRNIDKRISASFSLAGAANYSSVVVPVVSGQTEKIKDMLGNLLMHNPRRNDYQIQETAVKELAEGQEPMKMLMIAGPKDELEVLRKWADEMDAQLCVLAGIDRDTDPESFKQVYEVVDLKYIEPVHAQFDLTARVKGLYVTILPDPVTPGLTGEAKDEKQDTGSAEAATANNEKKNELTREIGHEQMRLVLRGTRTQIEEAKAYLQSVDVPARQVHLEMRVMELTRQEALKIGLDWSLLTGGRLTSFRMNQGLGGDITQGGHFTGHYQDNATTGLDVLGRLDAISNRNNLIARPNTLVTDGRSSHLFVGDTIRYIRAIIASQNGVTVETAEVEVGVTIDVTARVGAEGNIALDLAQKFSLLQGFTPVPGGGSIPQTSDRTSDMFINMRDGETIALGGLILEQDRKRVSGIPILKDIPLIGELFKRTDNSKDRTEVVFFVTAKVIDNTLDAKAAAPKTEGGTTKTGEKSSGN